MFGEYRADAGTEGGELHFSAVVHGEKEKGNRGHHVFESGGGLQAIHFGHGEIENYQVWRKFLGFLDGIRSVNGLAANGELAMSVEKAAELPTDSLMVVHNQYGSWHRPPPAKDQSCELPNCVCLDAGRRRRTEVGWVSEVEFIVPAWRLPAGLPQHAAPLQGSPPLRRRRSRVDSNAVSQATRSGRDTSE